MPNQSDCILSVVFDEDLTMKQYLTGINELNSKPTHWNGSQEGYNFVMPGVQSF